MQIMVETTVPPTFFTLHFSWFLYIQIKLTNELLKFANSSIDISDGLVDDLEKMINNQKISYEIWQEKVPISRNLHALC